MVELAGLYAPDRYSFVEEHFVQYASFFSVAHDQSEVFGMFVEWVLLFLSFLFFQSFQVPGIFLNTSSL